MWCLRPWSLKHAGIARFLGVVFCVGVGCLGHVLPGTAQPVSGPVQVALTQDRIVQDSLLQVLVLRQEHLTALADTLVRRTGERKVVNADSGLRLRGMITDQTLTRFGREVYDTFKSHWEVANVSTTAFITIRETQMPGWATRLDVSVNQDVVFQTQLMPQAEVTTLAGRQAYVAVRRHLSTRAQ